MSGLCTVSGPSFIYSFCFFKNLKHIILGTDYMKNNDSVNWEWAGLCTKENCSVVLNEIFTSLEWNESFEITSGFK